MSNSKTRIIAKLTKDLEEARQTIKAQLAEPIDFATGARQMLRNLDRLGKYLAVAAVYPRAIELLEEEEISVEQIITEMTHQIIAQLSGGSSFAWDSRELKVWAEFVRLLSL